MWAVRLHDDRRTEEGQVRLTGAQDSRAHAATFTFARRSWPTCSVGVIKPIQITANVAEDIANALRTSDSDAASQRAAALHQVENRRRTVVSKIDRGYEDFVSGRISDGFWSRKSAEWEAELQTIDAERARLERTHAPAVATAEKILELAKKADNLYKS
jgi:cell division septation protein DedD